MNLKRILKKLTKKEKVILISVAFFLIVLLIAVIWICRKNDSGKDIKEKIDQDPQEELFPMEEGAVIDMELVVDKSEAEDITHGIDVSRYQGTISWDEVAKSGIDFAMIRVGYRTTSSGQITLDSNAKYNMQEAQENGIELGAYFFSTATTVKEAIEEADWVCDFVSQYRITYPIAYNCEGFKQTDSRQYGMTREQRTDVALAFLERVTERGYGAMFYAAMENMEDDAAWLMENISSKYKVWVAQYPAVTYPEIKESHYSGQHAMWQYTNKGSVPGISTAVDVNVAYFGYEGEKNAQNSNISDKVTTNEEVLMSFTSVQEQVTAKDKTHLRDKPSQGEGSTVLEILENGQVATRTGISNNGWSRIEMDGEVYYAVSSYLTTDLGCEKPKHESDDEIVFKTIEEKVTAKEVVKLRMLPSVKNEATVVVAKLKPGETVIRTGINQEFGWSRVLYKGQSLYCISSYLMPAK